MFKMDYKDFEEMLRSPILWKEFKIQCSILLCAENCLFYEDYTALKDDIIAKGLTTDVALEEYHCDTFKRIYETYIKSGSPLEINVSDGARNQVRDAIKSNIIKRM
jgi:uncharacterized protein (UPF0297 family)